jgi:hypothetical protein
MLWGSGKYLPSAGNQTPSQVRSPSLYRLSYPVSFWTLKDEKNIKEKVVKRISVSTHRKNEPRITDNGIFLRSMLDKSGGRDKSVGKGKI